MNVNVELPPTLTGFDEKLLLSVGGFGGTGQPVNTMLSWRTVAVDLFEFLESAVMRKRVVLVPLFEEVVAGIVNQLPLFTFDIVATRVSAPLFALV